MCALFVLTECNSIKKKERKTGPVEEVECAPLGQCRKFMLSNYFQEKRNHKNGWVGRLCRTAVPDFHDFRAFYSGHWESCWATKWCDWRLSRWLSSRWRTVNFGPWNVSASNGSFPFCFFCPSFTPAFSTVKPALSRTDLTSSLDGIPPFSSFFCCCVHSSTSSSFSNTLAVVERETERGWNWNGAWSHLGRRKESHTVLESQLIEWTDEWWTLVDREREDHSRPCVCLCLFLLVGSLGY